MRYSIPFKQEVINFADNTSLTKAANKYDLSHWTVNQWSNKFRERIFNPGEHKRLRRLAKINNGDLGSRTSKPRPKRKGCLKYLASNNKWSCKNRHYEPGDVTAQDLARIARQQRLICPFTGQKLTWDNISIDHIIPLGRGGKDIPSNIQLVNKQINVMKSDLTGKEFRDLIQMIYDHSIKNPTLASRIQFLS